MKQRSITSILVLGFLILALYIGYSLISGIISEVQSQGELQNQTAKEILR